MNFSADDLNAVLDAHLPRGTAGIVAAVSGGADSAGLLVTLCATGASCRGLPVRAVHVDHGLQPAAASFREACASLCKRLNVPLTVVEAPVASAPGASIEAAARDARYAALASQLLPGECLLTAHHSEDQSETLLLQALRGAGLKGMSAMPICRPLGAGWHLRPLLDVSRRDLRSGAAGGSTAVEDPMNADMRFDRSYLRHQVWPLIQQRWPGAAGALARTARHLAEAQVQLDRTAASRMAALRDGDALSLQALRALDQADRMNTVRFWLCEAGAELPSTARLTEALRQMFDARTDHLPAIEWGTHALRRYRRRMYLTPAKLPRLEGLRRWEPSLGSTVDLKDLGRLRWDLNWGGIDAERLSGELLVRRRSGGETLKPAPRAKTQSVQHLCQSQGVLPWARDVLPLVFAGGALIAVADLWADARWCVPATRRGLCVVWDRAPIIV